MLTTTSSDSAVAILSDPKKRQAFIAAFHDEKFLSALGSDGVTVDGETGERALEVGRELALSMLTNTTSNSVAAIFGGEERRNNVVDTLSDESFLLAMGQGDAKVGRKHTLLLVTTTKSNSVMAIFSDASKRRAFIEAFEDEAFLTAIGGGNAATGRQRVCRMLINLAVTAPIFSDPARRAAVIKGLEDTKFTNAFGGAENACELLADTKLGSIVAIFTDSERRKNVVDTLSDQAFFRIFDDKKEDAVRLLTETRHNSTVLIFSEDDRRACFLATFLPDTSPIIAQIGGKDTALALIFNSTNGRIANLFAGITENHIRERRALVKSSKAIKLVDHINYKTVINNMGKNLKLLNALVKGEGRSGKLIVPNGQSIHITNSFLADPDAWLWGDPKMSSTANGPRNTDSSKKVTRLEWTHVLQWVETNKKLPKRSPSDESDPRKKIRGSLL